MKKKFFIFILFSFFILLLSFPSEAMEGASNGLLLWFHTVLPTLLPFIILTNLIIRLDAVHILCKFIAPIFHLLFGLSEYGSYALFTGLLCGYPMGAKVTADLIRDDKLSPEEGNFLLPVCNNASPMFLIGYVITQTLACPQHTKYLLAIVYGTPLLYAFCTNRFHHFTQKRSDNPVRHIKHPLPTDAAPKPRLSFQMIDDSIMNGFETITRLGGYIILFAIISKMATAYLHTVTISKHFIIGFIEITNGIHSVGTSALPLTQQIPVAIAIVTFGGLSGIAQTKSMTQDTPLSMTRYIAVKCTLTILAFLASCAYCLLIT